jgi:hypothetical protein
MKSAIEGEQHDDHIWLTFDGEGWAIERIVRLARDEAVLLKLWRGYAPSIDRQTIGWAKKYWAGYAAAAAERLAEEEEADEGREHRVRP